MKDKSKVEGYHFIWGVVVGVVGVLVVALLFRNGAWPKYEFAWSVFFVDARNIGLILAGSIGLWLAGRRLIVLESQDAKAQKKLDNEEVEKEDKDFIEALRMLGDKKSQSLRYAGLLALGDIANADPEKYYLRVYSILRSFVEEVPTDDGLGISRSNYENLTVNILQFIGTIRLSRDVRDIEEDTGFNLDFGRIEILGQWWESIGIWNTKNIRGGHFSGIHFWNAYMQGVCFYGSDVTKMSVNPPTTYSDNMPTHEEIEHKGFNAAKYDFAPSFRVCLKDFHSTPEEDSEISVWDDYRGLDFLRSYLEERDLENFVVKGAIITLYDSSKREMWLSKDLLLPLPKEWIVETIEY